MHGMFHFVKDAWNQEHHWMVYKLDQLSGGKIC